MEQCIQPVSFTFYELASSLRLSFGDLLLQSAMKNQLDMKLSSGDIFLVTNNVPREVDFEDSVSTIREGSYEADDEVSTVGEGSYEADDEYSLHDYSSASSDWSIGDNTASEIWRRCREKCVMPPKKDNGMRWRPITCSDCFTSHQLVCDWPSMQSLSTDWDLDETLCDWERNREALSAGWSTRRCLPEAPLRNVKSHGDDDDGVSDKFESEGDDESGRDVDQKHLWQPYPSGYAKLYKPIRCYNCRQYGHLAAVCINRKSHRG